MVKKEELYEFLDSAEENCHFDDENFVPKIKTFIKALFDKNSPEKPQKVRFLPKKWQKCPSCERIIKVNFYCPFCGQRVRERHYEWINDKLTFGPTDGWGVNT
jgi:hypothetical protein